ncbi:MAG TPA: S41 family peptidase [Candidatus Saccharimonadales bacterium]|nr:S41 family peptidase [Candidatus Saccharimonadales bacterium]
MFNEADSRRQPEEHYIESRHHWPLLKILLTLVTVLVVFGAGFAVGRGNVHWGAKPVSTSSLDYSSVNQLYGLLNKNFDGSLDQAKLLNGVKSGLVGAAGDPYTVYFSPADAKVFNNELSGTITGIGAELGTDDQNNIVVISPISGYPADKAGLKARDIIAAVNNQSTQGMSVDSVVTKIRGTAGSKVTLTIIRDSGNPFSVTITRQKITVPSVTYSEDNNIGYLKISQFSSDTVGLAQKAAQEFKSKNVKGVILDLRGDPGGYLSGAIGVSSLWLDNGKTVVSERRGATVVETDTANGSNPLKGLPTVVLIDGGSASASEITAGALHDNGAAQLVGEKSFGKGSVQQVFCLAPGGGSGADNCSGAEVKITIAHWYTPNGKNINKQGITPDITISSSGVNLAENKDPQKDKAIELLQAKF